MANQKKKTTTWKRCGGTLNNRRPDAVALAFLVFAVAVAVATDNNSHSTRLLAATTLRNVLGTKNLAEILSERETISHTMQSSLDEATDPWGVKVERVEM